MAVNYSDLELEFEFVSYGYSDDNSAYLNRETGEIYWVSDASEDVLPDDLYDNNIYIQIPNKYELDLGKSLVIAFVDEFLQSDIDTVYSIFSSKGAYSRYKTLLSKRDALDQWYEYEQTAQKNALIEWCKQHGIEFSI